MHVLGFGDGTALDSPTARLFTSTSNVLHERSSSLSSRFLFPSGDVEREAEACGASERPALIATLDAVNSVCSTIPADRVRPGLSTLGGGLKFWKGFGELTEHHRRQIPVSPPSLPLPVLRSVPATI